MGWMLTAEEVAAIAAASILLYFAQQMRLVVFGCP